MIIINVYRHQGGFMIINLQASGGAENLEDIFQLHQLFHISWHNHECVVGIGLLGIFAQSHYQ
jgi:hypothetical protein